MALFGKKEKKETFDFPELPKLPELPSLDSSDKQDVKSGFPQLPNFPRNNFDNKFARNSFKDLATGEKEEKEDEANEFGSFEKSIKTMPRPLENKLVMKNFQTKEFKEEHEFKEKEPIFIRLDKFKEAQHIFETSKKQLTEISRILNETKAIKEKETESLSKWEKELQEIKNQIEKIDRDLFSRV